LGLADAHGDTSVGTGALDDGDEERPLDLRIVRNEEGRGTPRGRLRRLVAFVGLC